MKDEMEQVLGEEPNQQGKAETLTADDYNKIATQYSKLVGKIQDMELDIKLLKLRRDQLQDKLLEYFTDPDSPSKMTIAGRTLSLRREVWVSLNPGTTAIRSARAHGLKDLVKTTINTQSLSGWYREMEKQLEDGKSIPKWVENNMKVSEKFKIAARKVTK